MIPDMKASVSIQVRVPHEQARLIKRAAKAQGKKLAAYVRDAALERASADAERSINEAAASLMALKVGGL